MFFYNFFFQMYEQCATLDTTGLKDPRLHENTKISALYNHGRLFADQDKYQVRKWNQTLEHIENIFMFIVWVERFLLLVLYYIDYNKIFFRRPLSYTQKLYPVDPVTMLHKVCIIC